MVVFDDQYPELGHLQQSLMDSWFPALRQHPEPGKGNRIGLCKLHFTERPPAW